MKLLLLTVFFIVMVSSDDYLFIKCGEVTVPYYLCNNGTLCTDGCQLFDLRKVSGLRQRKPDLSSKNKTKVPDLEVSPMKPSNINNSISCGNRNAQSPEFENGKAQLGEFPWMTAILREEEENEAKFLIYLCGGSVIHPEIILTSAQCVDQQESLKIRAGDWDASSKLENHQDRRVKNIIIHPDFNKSALKNDVALLILESPFELTSNIGTVCLPSQDEVLENLRCFGTGWGKDSFGSEGRYQSILKKVDLPIVQHDDCQKQFRTTRLGNYFILDNSFICAGGELGKDMCIGDGGSPLVCPIPGKKDKYHQRGLVSWGIGCGSTNPGAYGNVAYFRKWIDNEMLKLQFDTSTYTV